MGVGDIELPGGSTRIFIFYGAFFERRDDAEAQEQMLYLSRQSLADARIPELRLTRRKQRRPAIGRKQAIEKHRHQSAAQGENRPRNKFRVAVAAIDAQYFEPAPQRVGGIAALASFPDTQRQRTVSAF